MRRTDPLEKTLMLGKIEGRRRGDNRGWNGWMASPIQWTWVWVRSGSWWWTGKPGVLQSMGSQGVGHDLVTEQQQCLPYTVLSGSWSQKDCWLSTRVLGCGRVPQAKSCEHAVLSIPSIKSLPDSACLCFFSGAFRELFIGLVQFIVVTDGWIVLQSDLPQLS